MTEYNEDLEARLTALEGRLAFSEQRLAALERGGKMTPKRLRRELTAEEKQLVRERLVKGQEAVRAKREAEAKAEAEREKKEAK
ncbi:hypothetical protein ACFLV6_00640 [Chloroflexota bacterium]